MNESYHPLDSSETSSESQNSSSSVVSSESQNSESSSKESNNLKRKTGSPHLCFYNLGYENKDSQENPPTLEPSINFTVDAKRNGILT